MRVQQLPLFFPLALFRITSMNRHLPTLSSLFFFFEKRKPKWIDVWVEGEQLVLGRGKEYWAGYCLVVNFFIFQFLLIGLDMICDGGWLFSVLIVFNWSAYDFRCWFEKYYYYGYGWWRFHGLRMVMADEDFKWSDEYIVRGYMNFFIGKRFD